LVKRVKEIGKSAHTIFTIQVTLQFKKDIWVLKLT